MFPVLCLVADVLLIAQPSPSDFSPVVDVLWIAQPSPSDFSPVVASHVCLFPAVLLFNVLAWCCRPVPLGKSAWSPHFSAGGTR